MFYIYMLASRRNGALYTGSTDDLIGRVHQHRTHALPGFTARYEVTQLVWYEVADTREAAFTRERQIKEWKRARKIELIEAANPQWLDLYERLF